MSTGASPTPRHVATEGSRSGTYSYNGAPFNHPATPKRYRPDRIDDVRCPDKVMLTCRGRPRYPQQAMPLCSHQEAAEVRTYCRAYLQIAP
jgi:hypothetical protein